MKKVVFSLLLSSMIVFTGCSSDDEGGGNSNPGGGTPSGATTITVTPESATIDFNKQTLEFTITGAADWSITSDSDWATVSPSGGLKNKAIVVTASVSANTNQETRTATLTIKSGSERKNVTITQTPDEKASVDPRTLSLGGQATTRSVVITSNVDWTLSADQSWIKTNTTSGTAGEVSVEISVDENDTKEARSGKITITSVSNRELATIEISQISDNIVAPDGYTLVWNDEFNQEDKDVSSTLWRFENWPKGYVNNEEQRYVSGGKLGSDYTAWVEDGILNIRAMKVGNDIISARMNSRASWKYGYMEARINLPKGKGTWPAYWMMPDDQSLGWPNCGEIDIMEEVGVDPNYTSSSIHTTKYNHTKGTQKTASQYTAGAEGSFHIYALEWTESYIKTYVDGKQLFYFPNDGAGDNETWPFNKKFYITLNLAWGGSWGGYAGTDESALPCTMQVDYVRVFQKQ